MASVHFRHLEQVLLLSGFLSHPFADLQVTVSSFTSSRASSGKTSSCESESGEWRHGESHQAWPRRMLNTHDLWLSLFTLSTTPAFSAASTWSVFFGSSLRSPTSVIVFRRGASFSGDDGLRRSFLTLCGQERLFSGVARHGRQRVHVLVGGRVCDRAIFADGFFDAVDLVDGSEDPVNGGGFVITLPTSADRADVCDGCDQDESKYSRPSRRPLTMRLERQLSRTCVIDGDDCDSTMAEMEADLFRSPGSPKMRNDDDEHFLLDGNSRSTIAEIREPSWCWYEYCERILQI